MPISAAKNKIAPITTRFILSVLSILHCFINMNAPSKLEAYYHLFLIVTYILGRSFINNTHGQNIDWLSWMNQFIAGFFLFFGTLLPMIRRYF